MADAIDSGIAAPFVMHGAREILSAMPGALYIERQVVALETTVSQNPAMALDLAKALIETVCKTIMADRGHPVEATWDCPQLVRETSLRLHLVPDSHIGIPTVSASLRRMLSGLQTVVQGLCELRNAHGMASHGKDAYETSLEVIQAEFAARSADTAISFLFRAHKNYGSTEAGRRIYYPDNPKFNTYVDESNPEIQIFTIPYKPSDVLFKVDLNAYRDALTEFASSPEEP